MADEMERTALGVLTAVERDDPAALRNVFFAEGRAIGDYESASPRAVTAFTRPPTRHPGNLSAGAATVLARLALEGAAAPSRRERPGRPRKESNPQPDR